MTTTATTKPVRVGVFNSVKEADRAVHDLLAAGFTRDQISVICSDRHKAALFQDEAQIPAPAGSNTPQAILAGGATGAVVGGLALAATTLMTGGVNLLVAGGALISGGALAGSFAGAMMTRGLEPEKVNYYDQAVQLGRIVVAAEITEGGDQTLLDKAERILTREGTTPVPLVEG